MHALAWIVSVSDFRAFHFRQFGREVVLQQFHQEVLLGHTVNAKS